LYVQVNPSAVKGPSEGGKPGNDPVADPVDLWTKTGPSSHMWTVLCRGEENTVHMRIQSPPMSLYISISSSTIRIKAECGVGEGRVLGVVGEAVAHRVHAVDVIQAG
jgi:hypothetical protein